MHRPATFLLLLVLGWALASTACNKKKSPVPRHRGSGSPVATATATVAPTATPTAAPSPAELPTKLAVSRHGVFVGTSLGNVEKRPLGARAAIPLSAITAKPTTTADAGSAAKAGTSAEPGKAADASHAAAAAPTNVIAHGELVVTLAAALSGSVLAVTHGFGSSRSVWLYDQADLAVRAQLPADADGSRGMLLSDDGKVLMAHGEKITLWNTANGAKLAEVAAERPQSVRMNAAGTVLAVEERGDPPYERPMKGGGHEWIMSFPNISVMQRSGAVLQSVKEVARLADYALSPDGKLLIIGHDRGGLEVRSRSGVIRKIPDLDLARLVVSPDSKWAAVGTNGPYLELVDLRDASRTFRLPVSDTPTQIAFAADSRTVYILTDSALEVIPVP